MINPSTYIILEKCERIYKLEKRIARRADTYNTSREQIKLLLAVNDLSKICLQYSILPVSLN